MPPVRVQTIGKAIIYLGDCREVMRSIRANSLDLIVCDPPYGADWQASASRRREPPPKMALDGLNDRPAVADALRQAIGKIKPHRHAYFFGDWERFDFPLGGRCELIWDKTNVTLSGADTPWAKQHEPIWFGVKANAAQRRMNDGLRAAKLRRGTILSYQRKSGAAVKNHPTEKPVELLRELIESSSRIGDAVFDPFMGSGSTGVAALLESRSFVGIEINEEYFETAAKRLRAVHDAMHCLDTSVLKESA
jgi:site-specific DNA-methyltransferase (adenine-specific)